MKYLYIGHLLILYYFPYNFYHSLIFLLYNAIQLRWYCFYCMLKNLCLFSLLLGVLSSSPIKTEVLVDFDTFKVLSSKNIDERIYPASLTKIMLLLITFKKIEEGKLHLYDKIKISNNANRKPPSKLNIASGKTISVKDAIIALITKSANNVACALAEKIAGNEKEFAKLMNTYATRIGLTNSHFENASGLFHKNQYTTGRDLAKLSLCMMKSFTEKYSWFKTKSFKYNGTTHINHNNMIGSYSCGIFIDGIKTGYTYLSGFNIVVSAVKNGKRLLAIVTGANSALERSKTVKKLLAQGFNIKNPNSSIRFVNHNKTLPTITHNRKQNYKRNLFLKRKSKNRKIFLVRK